MIEGEANKRKGLDREELRVGHENDEAPDPTAIPPDASWIRAVHADLTLSTQT